MADLVRVKGPTTEYTTTRELAERDKLPVLNKPAAYESGHKAGMPLPPKPLESITEKVAAAKAPVATTKIKEA